MARTHASVSISLPPALKQFLDEVVAEGNYASASAVVHDALRLLQREREAYELRGEFIRAALAGPARRFEAGERGLSMDEVKARLKERRKKRLRSRIAEAKEALDAA